MTPRQVTIGAAAVAFLWPWPAWAIAVALTTPAAGPGWWNAATRGVMFAGLMVFAGIVGALTVAAAGGVVRVPARRVTPPAPAWPVLDAAPVVMSVTVTDLPADPLAIGAGQ